MDVYVCVCMDIHVRVCARRAGSDPDGTTRRVARAGVHAGVREAVACRGDGWVSERPIGGLELDLALDTLRRVYCACVSV